jgi:hypothetical protein
MLWVKKKKLRKKEMPALCALRPAERRKILP